MSSGAQKLLPFTTEVKFHVNHTDLLDWPFFMSPEFSYKGVSWNLILYVDQQIELIAKVLYRVTSKVSSGHLGVEIKINSSNRNMPYLNYLNETQHVFNITFEAGFKGQGLSDFKRLGTSNFFGDHNYLREPKNQTLTIGIAWGCYFSNSPNKTIVTPSDPQHVIKKLEALLFSEVNADVIFEVGEETIPAHRLILEAMSAVFSSMFELMDTKDTKDTKHIKVEDATAAGFKRMLRSLYTSQEPEWKEMMNEDQFAELLSLAHRYGVVPLLAHCERQMMVTLSVENVCDRLIAASTLNLQAVMNCIAIFVQNNKQKVLQTEKWKNLEENHSMIAIKALRTLLEGVNTINNVQGTDVVRDTDYVISKLEVIHSSKKHTDMVFVCEEQNIPAHRLILGVMSEVFRSMFELDTQEKRTGFVKIEDSTAEGFKRMLWCLYTSREPVWTNSNDLLELAYLADKYALEPLLAHCTRRIIATLARDTICQMVKASNILRMQEIMEPICDFLKNNMVVFNSKEWETLEDELPSTAVKVLHRVLDSVS